MKYTYKQTGVIVESDIPLDSANFIPVKRIVEEKTATSNAASIAPAKKPAAARRK